MNRDRIKTERRRQDAESVAQQILRVLFIPVSISALVSLFAGVA